MQDKDTYCKFPNVICDTNANNSLCAEIGSDVDVNVILRSDDDKCSSL